MRERDSEISRLNKIITDNRLGSKQSSSEISLLKEEIGAQSQLIRSLENQAENTLQLHKKIASQSTDIESLRAELHSARNTANAQNNAQHSATAQIDQIAQLKKHISSIDSDSRSMAKEKQQLQVEIEQMRSALAERDNELETARSGASQSTANQISTRKPRVFVRHDEQSESASSVSTDNAKAGFTNPATASASAENLAGTQMPAQMPAQRPASAETNTRRALYTRDGYRLKRTDGLDDLALLPGLSLDQADTLRKNKVSEFEQVALWSQREVAHFADHLGLTAAQAEGMQWPNAAKEILAGRYRVDASRVPAKN